MKRQHIRNEGNDGTLFWQSCQSFQGIGITMKDTVCRGITFPKIQSKIYFYFVYSYFPSQLPQYANYFIGIENLEIWLQAGRRT